jgi:predicted nuclease of predicted toxin-antitoxin system
VLRFHLDEHIPHAIAHGLRRRDIDVTTTSDAGLLNASDEEHIAFALQYERVILTADIDFLKLAATGISHAGIVFCPLGTIHIGVVVRYLAFMNECLTPQEMANHVEYITS